ncbi:MAG: metallophosphoesterase [Candidatus Limnocylindria bacterium]
MKVGLISDVHANLAALEAVRPMLDGLDEIWVTGDTVGYGPEPSAVLALLRGDPRVHIVAGNHDRAVATGHGLDTFNGSAAAAARLHHEWLDPAERDLLAALPATDQRSGFTLCHGSLNDPMWEYVTTVARARRSFLAASTPSWCCGHTHHPALYRHDEGRTFSELVAPGVAYPLGDRVMVNPGSVGQPRDGDPRSSFAVLDLDARTVTFHRVAYDIAATQRRMRTLELPEFLADRLASGR